MRGASTAPARISRSARWGPGAWLVGRWGRRRWTGAVPIAVVVAAGVAAGMFALGTAEGTSNAYGEYLDRSGAGHVEINASLNTAEIDAVIRNLPDVERVTTHMMFTASDDGRPQSRRELDTLDPGDPRNFLQIVGSTDGRFLDMDRPEVRAGRLATGPNEMMIDEDAARILGLGIGDTLELAFFEAFFSDPSASLDLDWPAADAYLDEVIDALGVEQLEVVGVVTFADEVLDDTLFPTARLVVSPDVAARYDCTVSEPAPGSSYAETVAALSGSGCSVLYRFHSVEVAGACSKCVLKAVSDEIAARNRVLRAIPDVDERNAARAAEGLEPLFLPGYFMIPKETEREAARVAQAVRPTVTSLVVVGLAAALLAVVLAGLLAARAVRSSEHVQYRWFELGIGTRLRMFVVAAPLVVGAFVGAAVGAGVAWSIAPRPLSVVSVVAASATRRVSAGGVTVALAIVVVVVVTAIVVAWRSTRTAIAPRVRRVGDPRSALRSAALPPAVDAGVRSAYSGRSAPPVFAGLSVLVAGVVAAAVFAASLSSLLATPTAYGWPWDTAAVTFFGYGGLNVEAQQFTVDDEIIEVPSDLATLEADPSVERLTVLGISSDVLLGSDSETTLIRLSDGSGGLTLLDGRLPSARDEVALGSATAERHGVGIDDPVEVARPLEAAGEPQPVIASVTGIVAFPVLGQFGSEHVAAGTGVLLPEASVGREVALYTATFVGVELTDDATAAERARVVDLLRSLGFGDATLVFDAAVRPSQIVDTGSVRSVPATVAAVFAVLAAIALTAATWATVRNRRHHLAVLRALGFDDTQVRTVVITHSFATVVVALAIGLPAGVITGRTLWRTFATELGVVPDPAPAWGVLALVVVAAAIVALAAAILPARTAARALPAAHLTHG